MYTVFVKAASFLIMIALGALSVRFKILTREEGKILNKIIMNFTLPCALAAGFGNVTFSFWMVIAILFGFCINLVDMFAARFTISRGCTPHETANNMLCVGTYNIGNFAIPFCQSFLPASSLAYLATFDLGNSIMTLGGAAAVAQNCIEKGSRFQLKALLRKFRSSVPLMCYLLLIFLSILRIRIPEGILTILGMIGQANVFLIMFMTGTQLDIHVERNDIHAVVKIIAARLIIAGIVSFLLTLLPLETNFRNVLIIAIFAPISGIIVGFAQQLNCDTKLTAMVSSVSMPVSLIVYMLLLFLIG